MLSYHNEAEKRKAFLAAEPGDLIFSRCSWISSYLVRWVTKFKYSHISVKINDRTIIDASLGGVHIRSIEPYFTKYNTVMEIVPLPSFVSRRKFIESLNNKIGAYYDYALLLGAILSRIFKISRYNEMFLHGASRYTCSEFVAESLAEAGMSFKFPPSQITPKDLYFTLISATKPKQPEFENASI